MSGHNLKEKMISSSLAVFISYKDRRPLNSSIACNQILFCIPVASCLMTVVNSSLIVLGSSFASRRHSLVFVGATIALEVADSAARLRSLRSVFAEL